MRRCSSEICRRRTKERIPRLTSICRPKAAYRLAARAFTVKPESRKSLNDTRFHWPVSSPILDKTKDDCYLLIAVRCWLSRNQCRPVPGPRLLALIASSSMQSHARFHANEAGTGFSKKGQVGDGRTHVYTCNMLTHVSVAAAARRDKASRETQPTYMKSNIGDATPWSHLDPSITKAVQKKARPRFCFRCFNLSLSLPASSVEASFCSAV